MVGRGAHRLRATTTTSATSFAGWHDAGAYLALPVALVVSQYASQKIMQPQSQSTDPAQQQTQAILGFLPLMVGWFSLIVPSGARRAQLLRTLHAAAAPPAPRLLSLARAPSACAHRRP